MSIQSYVDMRVEQILDDLILKDISSIDERELLDAIINEGISYQVIEQIKLIKEHNITDKNAIRENIFTTIDDYSVENNFYESAIKYFEEAPILPDKKSDYFYNILLTLMNIAEKIDAIPNGNYNIESLKEVLQNNAQQVELYQNILQNAKNNNEYNEIYTSILSNELAKPLRRIKELHTAIIGSDYSLIDKPDLKHRS